MNKISRSSWALLVLILVLAAACGAPAKMRSIKKREVEARISLSRTELAQERSMIKAARRDTLKVKDDEGKEVLIMKAIRDSESGEMVATEELNAAVVTARFRNVAERHGRIDLRFEVIVPASMHDTRWQLRFYPDMYILGDSVRLEPVLITGKDYRKTQLRGYQQYQRFLNTIINDSLHFVDLRNLEIFLERNIPELYRFKADSSYVSDEDFRSCFGVSEQDALEHYTNHLGIRINERRRARSAYMYAKYVKAPIQTDGIRLDTVVKALNGDFVYHYTQSIRTRPALRKVDIVLSGDIWESDKRLYVMPASAPLTFYISSLSAFVDARERYLTRIVERRAAAHSACYVDFAAGQARVDPELGHNATELARIREQMRSLLENETFDMDSIVIAAWASPEGSVNANRKLSEQRASAVAGYFERYIKAYRDSLKREQRSTISLVVGDADVPQSREAPPIRFLSRSNGENWPMLNLLVQEDSVLSAADKAAYARLQEIADADQREAALQKESWYPYLRQTLYPRLRVVKFDFFLHRKGMVKDSIHTTEPDTLYGRGVQALKDRDYEKALGILKDYRDFNTAIAYLSLDYNASAMAILEEQPRSAQVLYMLALLYARAENDEKAVQCYMDACHEDRSFVFRGNLDPEIYVLIQRYGLHKEDEQETL